MNSDGFVVVNGDDVPDVSDVFLSEVHAELAQKAIDIGLLTRGSCLEYRDGQRRYSYTMNPKAKILGGSEASPKGMALTCGSFTAREVPDTNLFLFMLTDECGKGWKDCMPCTIENCRNNIANATTKQQLCDCNRLLRR